MSRWVQRVAESSRFHRWLVQATGPYATVFTLHRPKPEDGLFNGISETLLKRCLEYAHRAGYEFVSIDELVKRALCGDSAGHRMVCITLDDGYADQLTRFVPLLLEYDAKPTLFVISDFADDRDWPWDAQLAYAIKRCDKTPLRLETGDFRRVLDLSTKAAQIAARRTIVQYAKTLPYEQLAAFVASVATACEVAIPARAPEGYRPATWDRLREWEQKGLRVGSHNRSHHILNALPPDRVSAELAHSLARLRLEIKSPSSVFCYPSGTARDFSPLHEPLVETAGYDSAITTLSRVAYFRDIRRNPYRISRIGFPETVTQFARYASWMEALRSKAPF
ncbi:polysaccharide deacetylase family protein [Marinimicrobium sp. ARAG 43.8]|uniref:polysaccharide deacetylase family protein n=1 Tax=Marinimicrobium sp. ARAG 43.8 TaxID=3418719 RepID=UPI003CE6C12A